MAGKNILERIHAENLDKAIVVSIRTPAEILALKNAKDVDFHLLLLDAPIDVRFERAKKTQRFVNMSFEDFKAQEDKQLDGTDKYSQQLGKVFEFADARLTTNFQTLDELRSAVDTILKGWGWL